MDNSALFLRPAHLAALALLLCIGCAPIRTNLRKSVPPRPEGSTVQIYDLTDSLPASAERLGSLQIRDFEPWIGYRYDALLVALQDETNRNGGNALRVTSYKAPTKYGSADHRIAADMLLLSDSVYTASYFGNLAAGQRRMEAVTGTDEIAWSDQKSAFNRNAVTFDAGYCFPEEQDRGFELSIGYQRIWNASNSMQAILGARYTKYYASVEKGSGDYKVRMDYIGPEFGGSFTERRLIIPVMIGFGYLDFEDNRRNLSVSGYGAHITIGCEYRISYRVGIGITYTYYADVYKLPDTKQSTHYRSSLDGGVRFYF